MEYTVDNALQTDIGAAHILVKVYVHGHVQVNDAVVVSWPITSTTKARIYQDQGDDKTVFKTYCWWMMWTSLLGPSFICSACTGFKCITKRTHGSSCDATMRSATAYVYLHHCLGLLSFMQHLSCSNIQTVDDKIYSIESSSSSKMLIDPFYFSTYPTFLKNMWHLMNPIDWYLSTGESLFRTCYQRSAAYQYLQQRAHYATKCRCWISILWKRIVYSVWMSYNQVTTCFKDSDIELPQDPWMLLSFRLRYVHIWKINKSSTLYSQQTKATSTSRRMMLIMLYYTWSKTKSTEPVYLDPALQDMQQWSFSNIATYSSSQHGSWRVKA